MGKSKTQRTGELRRRIDEYFACREAEGRFPTEAGMLLYLDMSEERYEKLLEDVLYRKEFDRARLARMDWLETGWSPSRGEPRAA